MEVYNFPHGQADAYLIQGAHTNPHLASPLIEQIEAMYNEVAPEFAVQQGLYYPAATNNGYICTGLESPTDWEDHQRIFGLDGQEIQYSGAQSENFPHVYYTPNYGYSESLYNPYNPYIPGAMISVDASYIGSQQYYSAPSYENSVSLPGFYPVYVQSQPDIHLNSTVEPFVPTSASITDRFATPGFKHNLSSTSAAFTLNPSKFVPNQTNSLTMGPDGSKVGGGPSKGTLVSSGFSNTTSSPALQGRGSQAVDNASLGKVWSNYHQFKVAPPSSNGLSSLGSTPHGRLVLDKVQTKNHINKNLNDASISPDALSEQNRGPRTNKSKKQMAVKAYTNKAGNSDAHGNIVICMDQYNKDDFLVDYVNAKFFVIKSYSEDDVHKSVKYNVWSSTPNGNKKLNIAYDDAQRLAAGQPRGCPIFLFFSVNASGQFCGVAEMTGMVDFHKDMDFWQQDKWCGSFPVKWHIIKDVPNPNFRHIILENNENKPVTNSRDTQEIRYKKGMEMLKIIKNYTSKTSLFDDFMYYENRQKLLQEEKAKLLIKSFENPFLVPLVEPQCKLNEVLDLPPNAYGKKNIGVSSSEKNASISSEHVSLDKNAYSVDSPKENVSFVAVDDNTQEGSLLKIGSLSINSKQAGMKTSESTAAIAPTCTKTTSVNTGVIDVLTVGSMPVKVYGLAKSAGFLTVGTIPLDPRALQVNAPGPSSRIGSRKG